MSVVLPTKCPNSGSPIEVRLPPQSSQCLKTLLDAERAKRAARTTGASQSATHESRATDVSVCTHYTPPAPITRFLTDAGLGAGQGVLTATAMDYLYTIWLARPFRPHRLNNGEDHTKGNSNTKIADNNTSDSKVNGERKSVDVHNAEGTNDNTSLRSGTIGEGTNNNGTTYDDCDGDDTLSFIDLFEHHVPPDVIEAVSRNFGEHFMRCTQVTSLTTADKLETLRQVRGKALERNMSALGRFVSDTILGHNHGHGKGPSLAEFAITTMHDIRDLWYWENVRDTYFTKVGIEGPKERYVANRMLASVAASFWAQRESAVHNKSAREAESTMQTESAVREGSAIDEESMMQTEWAIPERSPSQKASAVRRKQSLPEGCSTQERPVLGITQTVVAELEQHLPSDILRASHEIFIMTVGSMYDDPRVFMNIAEAAAHSWNDEHCAYNLPIVMQRIRRASTTGKGKGKGSGTSHSETSLGGESSVLRDIQEESHRLWRASQTVDRPSCGSRVRVPDGSETARDAGTSQPQPPDRSMSDSEALMAWIGRLKNAPTVSARRDPETPTQETPRAQRAHPAFLRLLDTLDDTVEAMRGFAADAEQFEQGRRAPRA